MALVSMRYSAFLLPSMNTGECIVSDESLSIQSNVLHGDEKWGEGRTKLQGKDKKARPAKAK